MSIRFSCERCGKTVKAPDAAAGKRARCPDCGAVQTIPAGKQDDDLIPLADMDDVHEPEFAPAPQAQGLTDEQKSLRPCVLCGQVHRVDMPCSPRAIKAPLRAALGPKLLKAGVGLLVLVAVGGGIGWAAWRGRAKQPQSPVIVERTKALVPERQPAAGAQEKAGSEQPQPPPQEGQGPGGLAGTIVQPPKPDLTPMGYIGTVVRSKKQAEVAVVTADLANVFKSIQIHASANDGKFPATPEALVQSAGLPEGFLYLPSQPTKPYQCIYIAGQNEGMPQSNVLIYEVQPGRDGKCHVLRLGGQVEMLPLEQAKAAAAQTKSP